MTSRNEQFYSSRQWAERRRIHQTMLEAQYFAAELVAGLSEPSAPEGRRCDICDDVVVDGKCPTCESVYIDGKRQPEFVDPFMESCLKCGAEFPEWCEHECEQLPFSDPKEITS